MIESKVSRKSIKEERIAICPYFGCTHLKKVKPLKLGVFGFRKYPKCSKHNISLVFVDEFIGNFIQAVNACLFDKSSLPPKNLIDKIKGFVPNEASAFINSWMYSNSIGRGAQVISKYMDGLSRGYMKMLSRKQRKLVLSEVNTKKNYRMLQLGLKKIADEYTNFLQILREKTQIFSIHEFPPFSDKLISVLKEWLKGHLNDIKQLNKTSNESLLTIKKHYDNILHAGTCTLLLGKSPSIVIKGISAFELFSAYYEFLEAGLSEELIIKDVQSIIDKLILRNEKPLIIPNFKQKVTNHLKNLINLIECTQRQKELINSIAIEILENFISRAKSNEFTIPKNANTEKIAAIIVYTVALSNKNMPKITRKGIAKLASVEIKSPSDISSYYKKYFEHLYPRIEFRFSSYPGFNRIRNIISAYIFSVVKDKEVLTSEIVDRIRDNIIMNIDLPKDLSQNDFDVLRTILDQYYDTFIKFLSDLVEVVKHLINSSRIHKRIRAHLIVKYVVDFLLEEKDVNFLQTPKKFYYNVIEIYDYLKEKYPDFFPIRSNSQGLFDGGKEYRHEDYEKIVGNKLKVFVMKNIYNGKYFKAGKLKCPECLKERFVLNTDITRLDALEFHHDSDKKETQFTAGALYNLFTKNRSDPNVLEEIVRIVELEDVKLICRNHHHILHDRYFNYFSYLITWEEILSLPVELIHILIKVSVENFPLTKNWTKIDKKRVRGNIIKYLKKRFIIEHFFGNYCPTCMEFQTKKHLPAFHFNHADDNIKNVNASDLYGQYSCSEIVAILEREKGGYLCSNCHSVIHYKKLHLLNEIYEDKKLVRRIKEDFDSIYRNFKLIHNNKSIVEEPLEKGFKSTGSIERYLTAINEISKNEDDVTIYKLSRFMGITTSSISNYFYRRKDVITRYINTKSGTKSNPTKYYLNKMGKEAISLIYHFRDYFRSL